MMSKGFSSCLVIMKFMCRCSFRYRENIFWVSQIRRQNNWSIGILIDWLMGWKSFWKNNRLDMVIRSLRKVWSSLFIVWWREVKKQVRKRARISILPESSNWKERKIRFWLCLRSGNNVNPNIGHLETVALMPHLFAKPLPWTVIHRSRAETFQFVLKRVSALKSKLCTTQSMWPLQTETRTRQKNPSSSKALKNQSDLMKTTKSTWSWSWLSHFVRELRNCSNLRTRLWFSKR